jgi:hypothetical protein
LSSRSSGIRDQLQLQVLPPCNDSTLTYYGRRLQNVNIDGTYMTAQGEPQIKVD